MKRISFLIGMIFLTICSFGQMKVTSVNVNFRSSPEINENKIGTIPKGTVVKIMQATSDQQNWTQISYNGKIGYVSSNYLKNVSPDSRNHDYSSPSVKGIKHYTNSNGERVQSPTHYNSAPAGATAECNDGTYSFSHSRRGTCSHHGGVKRWLK